MPKIEDKDSISETGNWNVAKDYSNLKIMGPLFLVDQYYDIAVFGSSDLVSELDVYLNHFPVDFLRKKGFDRLLHNLIKLIGNAKFAMKGNTYLKELEGYEEQLEKIEKIKHVLFKEITSQKTKQKTFKIDEEKYNRVLKIIRKIKNDINIPLNKSHLIFTDKEEFDPQSYKKLIMDSAIKRG